MKRYFILSLLAAGFWNMQPVQAKINGATFNSSATLTAGKLFLNQVDTVSLYLTTERIVYVPRLGKDLHLNVSLTLLGMSFGADPAGFQQFVLRHINAFNKTLKERLDFYSPELAQEFNPEQDVDFVVKVGADQKTVATWKEGKWEWADGSAPVSKILKEQANVTEGGSCKRKCPAMIGGDKPKEETPAPDSSAPMPQS